MVTSGAKAPNKISRFTARLKSCPDTCFVVDTFTAAAKAVLIEIENAGINACSTPRGENLPGLRPLYFKADFRGPKGPLFHRAVMEFKVVS